MTTFTANDTTETFEPVIEKTVPLAPVTDRPDGLARPPVDAGRMVFLDLIRAVAAPLVFYSHLASYWEQRAGIFAPLVPGIIDGTVRGPLRLEENFGFFGVALFFLVSGFVVTYRATRETAVEFAVKRILRIYPVLIVVVLVVGFVPYIHHHGLTSQLADPVDWVTVLTNATTANFFIAPQVVFVGVAWTLSIEVLFYLVLLLLMWLLKRHVWAAVLIEVALCWTAVAVAGDFGSTVSLIGITLSYLPVLLLGQLCWAVWSGRLPLWAAALYGVADWWIYQWAAARHLGRLDDGYGVAAALGLLIFILLLLAEPRMRPNRVVGYLADRSYSLYLWHGMISFPLMDLLRPYVPPAVVVVVAVLGTMLVVEGSFRVVEQPARRLARRLTRRRRRAATR